MTQDRIDMHKLFDKENITKLSSLIEESYHRFQPDIKDETKRWQGFHTHSLKSFNEKLEHAGLLPHVSAEHHDSELNVQGTYNRNGAHGKETYIVFADNKPAGPDHKIFLLGADGKYVEAKLNPHASGPADKFVIDPKSPKLDKLP